MWAAATSPLPAILAIWCRSPPEALVSLNKLLPWHVWHRQNHVLKLHLRAFIERLVRTRYLSVRSAGLLATQLIPITY